MNLPKNIEITSFFYRISFIFIIVVLLLPIACSSSSNSPEGITSKMFQTLKNNDLQSALDLTFKNEHKKMRERFNNWAPEMKNARLGKINVKEGDESGMHFYIVSFEYIIGKKNKPCQFNLIKNDGKFVVVEIDQSRPSR